MTTKQQWTRFTLLLITVLVAASWGLVYLGYWIYSNVKITWGG
jgi:hypothetical protein